ncbi:MAG: glycosyltransferase [Actinobacteria bacterium]|nr:glycosyltransferase [Actinomycetota bacterium]
MVAMQVGVVHDYLTQRGGAERVVLSMMRAFPDAALHTSLYEPTTTFPEFSHSDVRPTVLNRVRALRRDHRLALPLLAPTFSRLKVRADVVLCSTSGWAHGVRTDAPKVVYCHTPARWLYQTGRYLSGGWSAPKVALEALRFPLLSWDRRSAASADRYITNSQSVQRRIKDTYGIEAVVVPPPYTVDTCAPRQQVEDLDAGFLLCVSRLLPYKNVNALITALAILPGERLVVVGDGPERQRLQALAGSNVRFVGTVDDERLRWLYANCAAVIAASYEDYGLTPLEGLAFDKPSVVLRWGGFLDTVVEGETGVFFDKPEPDCIAAGVRRFRATPWSPDVLGRQATNHGEAAFILRLRQILAEVA